MKILIIAFGVIATMSLPRAIFAATTCTEGGGTCKVSCESTETQSTDSYSDCGYSKYCCIPQTTSSGSSSSGSSDSGNSEATVNLDNPLTTNSTDPAEIIGLIIKSALGLVGGIALVMTVYGGFQWLTSAGNAEKVKKGSATMIWSVVGLIFVLASYLLMQNVINFILGK